MIQTTNSAVHAKPTGVHEVKESIEDELRWINSLAQIASQFREKRIHALQATAVEQRITKPDQPAFVPKVQPPVQYCQAENNILDTSKGRSPSTILCGTHLHSGSTQASNTEVGRLESGQIHRASNERSGLQSQAICRRHIDLQRIITEEELIRTHIDIKWLPK